TDGYGGTVLSCSLRERAHAELVPADDTVLDICGERETIRSRGDLRLTGRYTDVAKAGLAALPAVPECRFHLKATADVPMRAGLAGSTAMLVAILGALLSLFESSLNRYEIAELARVIEFEGMGVVCGFQDQYMAAFGGLNLMDFR